MRKVLIENLSEGDFFKLDEDATLMFFVREQFIDEHGQETKAVILDGSKHIHWFKHGRYIYPIAGNLYEELEKKKGV